MKRILRLWPGRGGRAREIERELHTHIALRAEELVAAGRTPGDAQREAEAAFGDYAGIAAACGEIRAGRDRERTRRTMRDAWWQDVKHAARMLRRSPVFTLAALATLAAGVGGSTAIFSVVYGLLLEPLPFPAGSALVFITETNPATGASDYGISLPLARDVSAHTRSLESGGAFIAIQPRTELNGEPVRVAGSAIDAGAFGALRVAPALGRLPSAAEQGQPGTAVVVISDGLWRTRFGGEANVLGSTLHLNGIAHTIIGVMPRAFMFPTPAVEIWTPFPALPERLENRAVHILHYVGRLKDGTTAAELQRELQAVYVRGQEEQPGSDSGHVLSAKRLRDLLVGDVQRPVIILFAAMVALLLIAAANLAGLQLARAAARAPELAVRSALGAGRAAIMRQLVLEALLLGAIGCFGGIALARVLLRLLLAAFPGPLPLAAQIGIDARAAGFAALCTLFALLLFGLLPALQATRGHVQAALRAVTRATPDRPRQRLRTALVAGEVALAIVLVTGATLLGRSFARLLAQSPGFQPAHLLLMTITPSSERVPDTERVIAFYQQVPERLGALPGVLAASATSALPISGGEGRGDVTIDGKPFAPGLQPAASFRRVLPGYFKAAGIPLLAGREFAARDRGQEPFVTIVNESLARRHFGSAQAAVGQRIKVGPPENEPWLTIVGVVGDVRNVNLESIDAHATYEPHAQRPWRTMQLLVRAEGDLARHTSALRTALRELDAGILIEGVETMEQRIAASVAPRRFNAALLGSFGLLALLLSCLGVYGIIAFQVAERRRELGLRSALGASAREIRVLVLRRGLHVALAGCLLGVPAALLLARYLRTMLFEVEATDPVSLGIAVLAILAAALLASWWPARRAARWEPAAILRER